MAGITQDLVDVEELEQFLDGAFGHGDALNEIEKLDENPTGEVAKEVSEEGRKLNGEDSIHQGFLAMKVHGGALLEGFDPRGNQSLALRERKRESWI